MSICIFITFCPTSLQKKILRWLAIFFLNMGEGKRSVVNTKKTGKTRNNLGSRKHAISTIIFCLHFWHWPQCDGTFQQPVLGSGYHTGETLCPLGRAVIPGSEAGQPFPYVSSMSFQTGVKTPGYAVGCTGCIFLSASITPDGKSLSYFVIISKFWNN